MSIKAQNEWNSIKPMGKLKYIIFHWILFAAIPAAVILVILYAVLSMDFNLAYLLGRFLRSLILCTFLAVILGLWKWNKLKKAYGEKDKKHGDGSPASLLE